MKWWGVVGRSCRKSRERIFMRLSRIVSEFFVGYACADAMRSSWFWRHGRSELLWTIEDHEPGGIQLAPCMLLFEFSAFVFLMIWKYRKLYMLEAHSATSGEASRSCCRATIIRLIITWSSWVMWKTKTKPPFLAVVWHHLHTVEPCGLNHLRGFPLLRGRLIWLIRYLVNCSEIVHALNFCILTCGELVASCARELLTHDLRALLAQPCCWTIYEEFYCFEVDWLIRDLVNMFRNCTFLLAFYGNLIASGARDLLTHDPCSLQNVPFFLFLTLPTRISAVMVDWLIDWSQDIVKCSESAHFLTFFPTIHGIDILGCKKTSHT